NRGVLADRRLYDVGERVDHCAVVDRNARSDHHERFDGDVLAEPGVGGEINRLWRNDRDARVERVLAQALLHDAFGFRQLRSGVDAAYFVFAGFNHDGLQSHIPDNTDRIDQIELALAVCVAYPVENPKRTASIERHDAGIAQRDLAFIG